MQILCGSPLLILLTSIFDASGQEQPGRRLVDSRSRSSGVFLITFFERVASAVVVFSFVYFFVFFLQSMMR